MSSARKMARKQLKGALKVWEQKHKDELKDEGKVVSFSKAWHSVRNREEQEDVAGN